MKDPSILLLFFTPIFLWLTGGMISEYPYDPFERKRLRRDLSNIGIQLDLRFWRMTEDQWKKFSKELAPRYFKVAAALDLAFNLLFVWLVKDGGSRMCGMMFGWLAGFLGTVLLLWIKTKD